MTCILSIIIPLISVQLVQSVAFDYADLSGAKEQRILNTMLNQLSGNDMKLSEKILYARQKLCPFIVFGDVDLTTIEESAHIKQPDILAAYSIDQQRVIQKALDLLTFTATTDTTLNEKKRRSIELCTELAKLKPYILK